MPGDQTATQQESKQRVGRAATSPLSCHTQPGLPSLVSSLPAAAAPRGQAGVQRPTALLETVSVPRLPGRTSRRPRDYSTTHQGLKNTSSVFPPTLRQLEWGAWSKPKDPSSRAHPPHLQWEPRNPSNTVHSIIAQRALVGGKTQAPKALHREEVPWGPM